MKLRLLLISLVATFFLLILGSAVIAQGEPPPPYAGMTNPFSWDDTSVQKEGKGIYQRSCLFCHGDNGANLAEADFSNTNFTQSLEERADFYFWILSEGRLDKGMPPFKSTLSEEQRWHVLTYLSSLGATTPTEVTTPPSEAVAEGENGSLQLTAPEQSRSGQPLTLNVLLKDNQGQPLANAMVQFLVSADLFTSGLMEVGEALTNEQGISVFKYTPRQTGEIDFVARYQTLEITTTISLEKSTEPLYQAEAGLPHTLLPLPEIFIGPKSALEPGEGASAPTTGLRIPGDLPFLLFWAYLLTVMLVWGLYLRVMYQVLCIPITSEITDTNTRLLPIIGLVVMAGFIIMLVLIFITGPYTNPHLLR